MTLVFRRTGQRRYAVEALRSGFPDVVFDPAPGYDRHMPHDMMHLVVEARLGLSLGIFGQLAAGGNAGTFQLSERNNQHSRETKRNRKRSKTRGKRLLKRGRDECLVSERATYICWQEWLSRSSSRELSKLAKEMAQQAKEVRNTALPTELRSLNKSKLDDICKHLDELSSHWFALDVGQSVAVSWPDLAVVNSG